MGIKTITRESMIKNIAKNTMMNVEIAREFYDSLENAISEYLSNVTENESVVIKLFNGITINGVFVPEHKIRNNNVSNNEIVPSKIKPRFNVSKSFMNRLNCGHMA